MSNSDLRTAGFTLIELLVVMAILAVLIPLALPGLTSAREPLVRRKCSVRLRTLVLSLHTYALNHRGTFPFAEQGSRTSSLLLT